MIGAAAGAAPCWRAGCHSCWQHQTHLLRSRRRSPSSRALQHVAGGQPAVTPSPSGAATLSRSSQSKMCTVPWPFGEAHVPCYGDTPLRLSARLRRPTCSVRQHDRRASTGVPIAAHQPAAGRAHVLANPSVPDGRRAVRGQRAKRAPTCCGLAPAGPPPSPHPCGPAAPCRARDGPAAVGSAGTAWRPAEPAQSTAAPMAPGTLVRQWYNTCVPAVQRSCGPRSTRSAHKPHGPRASACCCAHRPAEDHARSSMSAPDPDPGAGDKRKQADPAWAGARAAAPAARSLLRQRALDDAQHKLPFDVLWRTRHQARLAALAAAQAPRLPACGGGRRRAPG